MYICIAFANANNELLHVDVLLQRKNMTKTPTAEI